jgi:hypothetical protein
MTKKNIICYEASDADAMLIEGDEAVVMFQTVECQIAVRMQQRVCELLYKRLKLTLGQPT